MTTQEKFPFWLSNGLLFIQAIAFLTVGGYMQKHDFTMGILVTEYLIVFAPVILLIVVKRLNLVEILSLRLISLKTVGKIMVLALLMLPTIYFVNMLTLVVMTQLGHYMQIDIPIPTNVQELGVSLALISLSAGICEETLFRGMVLGAYKGKVGPYWALIASSVLFGLFHFNPINAFGPIVLGLVFGYLVFITRSLFAGIVAHMTNNGIAVLLGYWANAQQAGVTQQDPSQNLEALLKSPLMAASILGVSFLFMWATAVPAFHLIQNIRREYYRPVVDDTILLREKRYLIKENDAFETSEVSFILIEEESKSEQWIEYSRLESLKPKPVSSFFKAEERRMPEAKFFLPVLLFFFLYGGILAYIMYAL